MLFLCCFFGQLAGWLGGCLLCFGFLLVNGLKQKKICIRELSKKSLKRQIRMSLRWAFSTVIKESLTTSEGNRKIKSSAMLVMKVAYRMLWRKNERQGNWLLITAEYVIIQTRIIKNYKHTWGRENILISLRTILRVRNDVASDKSQDKPELICGWTKLKTKSLNSNSTPSLILWNASYKYIINSLSWQLIN